MAAQGRSSSLSTRHPSALSSTNSREDVTSTAANFFETGLKLAKDVGEMLKDVPYVKAVAGIIVQIIEIRDVCFIRIHDVVFPYPSLGNQHSKGAIS
jgi:hypothetical protein